jgi:hypothetical protein
MSWAFPYWPETKPKPIFFPPDMGLDMEMILEESNNKILSPGVKIMSVYFSFKCCGNRDEKNWGYFQA